MGQGRDFFSILVGVVGVVVIVDNDDDDGDDDDGDGDAIGYMISSSCYCMII